MWQRYRHNQQIFFDVNDQYDPEACLGHLKRYTFKELRSATNHFSSKNILGRGGFGIVYKGCLNDGTMLAVKRLKDYNALGGEIQFQTEVEMISLAVHCNVLLLLGFCTTKNERLLVYSYMPNGSVASRLRGIVVTNDGNAILRELDLAQSATKSTIELCRTQDEEVEDGTTSVIVLAYNKAFEDVIAVLDKIALSIDVKNQLLSFGGLDGSKIAYSIICL